MNDIVADKTVPQNPRIRNIDKPEISQDINDKYNEIVNHPDYIIKLENNKARLEIINSNNISIQDNEVNENKVNKNEAKANKDNKRSNTYTFLKITLTIILSLGICLLFIFYMIYTMLTGKHLFLL